MCRCLASAAIDSHANAYVSTMRMDRLNAFAGVAASRAQVARLPCLGTLAGKPMKDLMLASWKP